MSCTHPSDLCALLQTRVCEGRCALLCLLLLSSSQETRLFKQLLQQLIITLNTHKRLLLLCSQMREGYNNSVCVCVCCHLFCDEIFISSLRNFIPLLL